MMKLSWGAVLIALAAAACSGGKDKPKLVDASTQPTTCSPLTQAGCNAGEKCAWIEDVAPTETTEAVGHIGCVPDGTKQLGEQCTQSNADGTGHSDCVAGTECVAGFCRQICDHQGGEPMCDANHACAQYSSLFETADQTIAGVCDVRCDPLTQTANAGSITAACGTSDPTKPRFGCYGDGVDFTCAPNSLPGKCSTSTDVRCNYSYNDDVDGNGMNDRCPTGETCNLDMDAMRVDRVAAATPGPNTAYINGCAPGFVPFFFEMTGSTTVVCSGLCSPMKTDTTLTANVIGNPNTPAKLPLEAAPAAGNAVCVAGKKGSLPVSGNENCLHMWPFNVENNMLPQTPYNDTLGVCRDFTQYTYDDDNNQNTPRVGIPSCHQLPPKGTVANCTCNAEGFNCSGTGCPHGQAHEWGCYNVADSGVLGFKNSELPANYVHPALREQRVGELGEGTGVRHRIVQF